MLRNPDFRGRNQQEYKYIEAKQKARGTVYKPELNKNKDEPYEKYLKTKEEETNEMSIPINQALLDEAKHEEYLRQNPHLKEDCFQNTKDCIAGALKWAFPTKSDNTIKSDYDSAKKNNGGKKSRKPHNSKKQRKSKKSKRSHTTKRSRR